MYNLPYHHIIKPYLIICLLALIYYIINHPIQYYVYHIKQCLSIKDTLDSQMQLPSFILSHVRSPNDVITYNLPNMPDSMYLFHFLIIHLIEPLTALQMYFLSQIQLLQQRQEKSKVEVRIIATPQNDEELQQSVSKSLSTDDSNNKQGVEEEEKKDNVQYPFLW